MRLDPLALLSVLLLTGCPPFKDDGVYKCDPKAGRDCVVETSAGWTIHYAPQVMGVTGLRAVMVSGEGKVLVGGRMSSGVAALLSWDGSAWERLAPTGSGSINALIGTTAGPVAAGGVDDTSELLVRWRQGQWSATENRAQGGAMLSLAVDPTVEAASGGAVWMADQMGSIKHLALATGNFDGSVSRSDLTDVVGLWTQPNGDLWGISSTNTVVFWSHANPTAPVGTCRDNVPGVQFHGVWGPNDSATAPAYIVGGAGAVIKADPFYGGTTCAGQPMLSLAANLGGEDLRAICGTSAADMFAVGDKGRVVQYAVAVGASAGTWSDLPRPTSDDLTAVACTATDLWAVSATGQVLHKVR
jgi:hypothetical protein